MKYLLAIVSIAMLAGCATAYQKDGFSGGFDETQLAPNAWKVHFRGNGYTSKSRAESFTLLRSADLTLQSGFQYFVIVSASSDIKEVSSWTAPTTSTTNATATRSGNMVSGTATTTYHGGSTQIISKPSSTNTIVMFKTEPQGHGLVYDARFLCNSMGAKYQVQCGTLR